MEINFMFKKLVANLPFNPSLISQVSFYSKRLHQERSVRRLSFLFIAIAMVVQIFAVVSPPEKSLASSPNHILDGIKSKEDILRAWDSPTSDVSAIYGVFGVTRDDIVNLKPANLFSNDGNDYWTIGRTSLTAYSSVAQKYKDSQITIQYAGQTTSSTTDDKFVYERQLRAWDIKNPGGNWYYGSFKGTLKSTGETFWILGDCGNFTKIGKYTPENPKPDLKITKTIIDKPASLKPGDSYSYLIQYRNTVNGTTAENVQIIDRLDVSKFDVTKVEPSDAKVTNGILQYDIPSLPFSTEFKNITITVKLKDQISSGSQVCNASRITANNASAAETGQICIGVINPCPFDGNVGDANNPNCIEPKLVCSIVDAALNRTTRNVDFKTTVTSSNASTTQIKSYSYDFGDGSAIATQTAKGFTDEISHVFGLGEFTTKVSVTYTAQGVSGEQKIDCSASVSFDDKPLGQSKTVKNITQDKTGQLAVSSKVQPNDIIEYELKTTNAQNYNRNSVDVSDYIGDILDYAVLDVDFLKQQNGTYDEATKKVVWNINVPANGAVLSKFRVSIKSPVPSTNSPSNVSTTFDCKISNDYGNEITIDVNCPIVKSIESLPNTGPGSSVIMMSGITFIVAYFYFRSRLMSKEIDLVRNDYAAMGGI